MNAKFTETRASGQLSRGKRAPSRFLMSLVDLPMARDTAIYRTVSEQRFAALFHRLFRLRNEVKVKSPLYRNIRGICEQLERPEHFCIHIPGKPTGNEFLTFTLSSRSGRLASINAVELQRAPAARSPPPNLLRCPCRSEWMSCLSVSRAHRRRMSPHWIWSRNHLPVDRYRE